MTKVIAAAVLSSFVIALAGTAALADFAQKHPRRAQVNRRDRRQKNANNAAAVNGKISDQQAQHLDHQDNKIQRQERADAAANGGHITKGEQNQLNREQNHVNSERRTDERNDAAANGGGSAPSTSAPPASN